MSRRPPGCRCCLRPAAGTFCEGCGTERTRAEFRVRSVVREIWGADGLTQFDTVMRARRLEAARRGRERRVS